LILAISFVLGAVVEDFVTELAPCLRCSGVEGLPERLVGRFGNDGNSMASGALDLFAAVTLAARGKANRQ
jgi:hypothetical protein